jgi:hypothetical protein
MKVSKFSIFEHTKDEWDNIAPIVMRLNKFLNNHLKQLYDSQDNFLANSDAFHKDFQKFRDQVIQI